MVARKEVTFVIRARDLTRRVFGRIRRSLGSLRTQITAFLGLAGLGAGIQRAGEYAQSIDNLAAQARLSTTEFQAFTTALRRFGLQTDDVADIFFSLNQATSEALNFDQRQLEAFRRLGIDLQGDPISQFLQAAQSAVTLDPRQAQEFFSVIFGEDNARRLLPALQGGASGLVDNLASVLEGGLVVPTENIQRASDAYASAQDAAQALLTQSINAGVATVDALGEAAGVAVEKFEQLQVELDRTTTSLRELGDATRERFNIENPPVERSGAPLVENDSSYG